LGAVADPWYKRSVIMSFRAKVAGCFAVGVGLALFGGCKKEQQDGAKANVTEIERCEKGIERAILQTDTRQAMKTYYGECAGIYSEQGCRQGYQAAAEAEPSEQMSKVLEGCRAAYCPKFPNQELEACKPDFKPEGLNIMRAWPPLHEAILERDARAYAPRVSRAMLVFYSRVMQRMGGAAVGVASASAAGAAVAGDAGAATAGDAAVAATATGTDAAKAGDAGKSAASAQAPKGAGATRSP
jgi:hypothetical protein